MKINYIVLFLQIMLCTLVISAAKSNSQKSVIDNITDAKDLKKILRTKNNVLICFIASTKNTVNIVRLFREVADIIKGQGTMILVDCSGDAKKMCKKLKVSPDPYLLKHYRNGDPHKDYDRRETVSSMVNFMRDPTGDLPWEEDPLAQKVVHIADAAALSKFLKRETKPIMMMFYAPWCGFCKTLKPEYAQAASELDGHAMLAAIDVNRPENAIIRTQYNITGFPTLLYYENGKLKQSYEGENTKSAIVSFMRDPDSAPVKSQGAAGELDWSDTDSEVVHLTTESFKPALQEEPSVLVMFYAPWCGHCKKMKPEYEKAAAEMKSRNIPGVLAALDATKEPTIASQYQVKGYPTVKYFVNGEFKFDANVREAAKIVEFMKDPKEPPPPPPPERPWSEEQSEVVHLDEDTFKPFIKKKKYVLVMFYAPWCGHCKRAKPEFAAAAERHRDDPKVEYAAVDCTQHRAVCSAMDVTGYPTIKCFTNYNKDVLDYNGGRTESDFTKYMSSLSNPAAAAAAGGGGGRGKKLGWENVEGSENILELTDDNFDAMVAQQDRILVLFYAPWCGVCTRVKPSFARAALEMSNEKSAYRFGSVDTSVHEKISKSLNVEKIPTWKLYEGGQYVMDYSGKRDAADFKNFLLTKSTTTTKDEL